MTEQIGDPQGTQARALDTERQHPVHPEEPPPSYRRNLLLVLALLFGVPLMVYALTHWV